MIETKPWADNAALPDSWRAAGYSEHCMTVGRNAANSVLARDGTDESAARIFHAVAKRCDGKALDAAESKAIQEADADVLAIVVDTAQERGDGSREVKDLAGTEYELKDESSTGYKTLAGYVSAFSNVDEQDDVVDPGAFAKTIIERVDAGKVKLLTDHVWSVPTTMGTFARAAEDTKGLEFEAGLIQRVGWVQDAAEAAAQGHVSGLSIGYEAMRRYFETLKAAGKAVGKRIRHLAEIKLYEGSLTPFPANELASVTGVKAQGRAVALAKMQLDSLVDTLRMGGRHTDPEDRAMVADAITRLQSFLDDPDGQPAPVIEAASASTPAHRMAWAARAAQAAHQLQRYTTDDSQDRGRG